MRTSAKIFKNLPVSEEVYQQLVEYKRRMGHRTFNNAVLGLLKEHRELRRYHLHRVLCTKYKGARASLSAWMALLGKEGFNKHKLSIAWEYLTFDESSKDTPRVSEEKCNEPIVSNIKERVL